LNALVLKLLFLNARWHALAKLRMQNEATIVLLEEVTTQLGDLYRQFAKDTDRINTLERPNEAEKRTKAASKKAAGKKPQQAKGGAKAASKKPQQAKAGTAAATKKAKQTKSGASSHLHHPAPEFIPQVAQVLYDGSQHHTRLYSNVGGYTQGLPTQPYPINDLRLLSAPGPVVSRHIGGPSVQNYASTFGPPLPYAAPPPLAE
jgi:hypothetical protein